MQVRGETGRSRWAAIGAAVAVVIGSGGLMTASASTSSGLRSVFVPIAPCRLLDTRPAPDNVGTRNTPLGPGDTFVATVRGSNGNCAIPTDAVGISMNVAIIQPSVASFLTVFPADAERPLAANLNWVGGQAPTPNAVTARLSADGKVAFYNLAGTVHIAADVNGYYVDHDHDDRYDTKDQLAHGAPGLGVLERMSDAQLATLRWDQDPAREGTTVDLAAISSGIAFDGTRMWATLFDTDRVVGLDRATGAIVATVSTNIESPRGIAFDGSYLWVANSGTASVAKIDPRTATLVDTIAVGNQPWGVAFDGTSIWVTNFSDSSVSKINPVTDAVIGTYPVGANPIALSFDGTTVWVANSGANSLSKIDPVTNAVVLIASALGGPPYALAFDGRWVWVIVGNTVHRIDPATSSYTGISMPLASTGLGLAYDGHLMWATSAAGLYRLDWFASTWIRTGTDGGAGIAFDGTSIWWSTGLTGRTIGKHTV